MTTSRKRVCICVLSCTVLLFVGGCTGYVQRDFSSDISLVQGKVNDIVQALTKIEYGSDETINLLRIINAGNTASAPWNPLAVPIGVGLTGVITVLESLRRKEKDGRKYAEHELNNNKNKVEHG